MSWLRRGLILGSLAIVASACRFMPNEPYWIEGFGAGQAVHVAAWPQGALVVGTNAVLYTYPGPWAQPWVAQPSPALRAIAASPTTVYGLQSDGQVARRIGAEWQPLAGSATWNAQDIGATEDDRILVVAGGALHTVEGEHLKQERLCASITVASAAGVRGSEAFLLDQSGALHRATNGRCESVETPVAMQRIAVTTGRLLAVGVDGSIWRRRDGGQWQKLPAPIKYRTGRHGFPTEARQVAVSANSSWILDREGSIFVLSDET